jgi:hypothetical protein
MKHKKLILWLFIGAATYLVLMGTTDYSKLAFYLAIGIVVYIGLLKTFPDAARFWLGIGGAIGGAILWVCPWSECSGRAGMVLG